MQSDVRQRISNTQTATKSILLVEDDAAIAELLVQIIVQETPYRVLFVPDGLQALDMVKNIRPNLLLLDYWLPVIHGIELYDRLSAIKGMEQIPTIMLSVNPPMQEIKKRQITCLRKPFDVDQLLHTIQSMMG
ncbi:MAG TPA: response regulator [Ktedonobacteraceae bacterium]